MATLDEEERPSSIEDGSGAKINLDTLLVTEIGQFGMFQLRMLVLAGIVVIFGTWAGTEYMFSTARINTRCLIPECDSSTPEFTPEWILSAVPSTGGGFDNCQRFANVTAATTPRPVCPATFFDQYTLLECDEYVYENTHTVVYDFGLACDEWRRSLIGSVRTLGSLTALPLTGYISDRWGRRIALTINAFNTAWLGLIRYFANSYTVFVISEFVESTFGSGAFTSIFILMTELVGPKYRVAMGATMSTFFSVGQILMGLIAWAIPNWRNLTLILYAPQLLTISYFWLVSESIRWYMSKGRFEESEAILKKVARVNKKEICEKSLEALRHTAEQERNKRALDKEHNVTEPWLAVLVFRHKKILTRCLVLPVWWITCTLVYYGLSINSVNMSGNRYVNYILVAAADIPGYWTAVLLMDRIGRKPVLAGAFWICAACQITYMIMPEGLYAASLAVYLIGKYSIAVVATSIYVYTAELFPTKYRHSLFAFSSMMGRFGSILAPLTPALGAVMWVYLPFILFTCLSLLSGLLIFLTPETLGCKLPDTMEEAELIGQKKQTQL